MRRCPPRAVLGGYAACARRRPLPSVILGGLRRLRVPREGHGGDLSRWRPEEFRRLPAPTRVVAI